MARLKIGLAWLAIVAGTAGLAAYFFDASFWPTALLVAVAVTANGVLAFREDRGEFND